MDLANFCGNYIFKKKTSPLSSVLECFQIALLSQNDSFGTLAQIPLRFACILGSHSELRSTEKYTGSGQSRRGNQGCGSQAALSPDDCPEAEAEIAPRLVHVRHGGTVPGAAITGATDTVLSLAFGHSFPQTDMFFLLPFKPSK